ncbi:5-methylcytosine rRNA methyltransferase NSUN4 [Orussus abietinus]|uniref:5-methylcytosine rRNA methyltransferase NSUN4 n=1 Tax=Orussus abietinus TaxID=222816 RepID=UPI0006256FF2|nr:5-methylcytosine rRNA methyltransferase NSUN4 [Orussus abietinus]
MMPLFNKIKITNVTKLPVRYKNGPNHWSVKVKAKTPKDKALEHFDDFYASVYGKTWESIRAALLSEHNKCMAVINNFSDTERVFSSLEESGAINVKSLYNVYKNQMDEDNRSSSRKKLLNQIHELDKQMDAAISKKQLSEIQSIYPTDCETTMETLNPTVDEEGLNKEQEPCQPVMTSIESGLETAAFDETRIVKPGMGISSSCLYEFVPTTKIKGMEDWILESTHYNYYKEGADFSVNKEKEYTLKIPEYLHLYAYEPDSSVRFKSPKKGSTGVLDYYLLDGGSILPVLALDLQPGDNVLDMCAAPGGKFLASLQTLLPRVIVANDSQSSRVKRINNVLHQYISDMGQWDNRLFVTEQDARFIDDKDVFNKILVDVPCTTDRHILHSDENNIFKPTRIKERLRIPELQTEILVNALKIVPVGGTVVYSTCSLSPVQNDGVVQLALKKAWEETNSVMVVRDMTRALQPLSCLYKFGSYGRKYGHTVIPTQANNWGPLYFAKIIRLR